jgi:hypothetical protein
MVMIGDTRPQAFAKFFHYHFLALREALHWKRNKPLSVFNSGIIFFNLLLFFYFLDHHLGPEVY